MTAAERRQYGADRMVTAQEDDCTVYRITNQTGQVVMTRYAVFPGIDLVYHDVHIQFCRVAQGTLGHVLEINHCREGRIQCQFQDECFYLAPGDMAVAIKEDAGHDTYFPIRRYHGISIIIDMDQAPDSLSRLLDDVNVSPAMLREKFCADRHCCVLRAHPAVQHLFSQLYSVPEGIRKGDLKVKILELLLFLSGMELEEQGMSNRGYSCQQVLLAKTVCKYLTDHMERRVTLKQLTERFNVSGTHLKNCFKGVYGTSIYAYIRAQKMQAAALLLRDTDETILTIAGRFGYDNGSKFAKAFADVMGITPAQYRAAGGHAPGEQEKIV